MRAKLKMSFRGRCLLRWMLLPPAAIFGLLVLLLLGLWYAEEPVAFETRAAAGIHVSPPRQLVPGPVAPPGSAVMDSNNNVDLARFEGRFYMAYRTAPSHFASADTRLVIVSSTDRDHWKIETTFGLAQSDCAVPILSTATNSSCTSFVVAVTR